MNRLLLVVICTAVLLASFGAGWTWNDGAVVGDGWTWDSSAQ